MDVRVRGLLLEKAAPSFMLELLVCLLVMGTVTLAATRGIPRIFQRLYVMETVSLSSAPTIDMMEYRAVTGEWPSLNTRVSGDAGVIREGGAVDYAISARAGDVAGKIVTFRAWQLPGAADLPVVWLCGHAGTTPMTAAGVDRTTLIDNELPSPCRART